MPVAGAYGKHGTFAQPPLRPQSKSPHYALASLTRHLLRIVFIEIEFVGDLVVREVEPHEIQAQYPHPRG